MLVVLCQQQHFEEASPQSGAFLFRGARMDLVLKREPSTPTSTPGRLLLRSATGDTFLAFTLEDIVRNHGCKIPGKTAIPAGSYEIRITMSNRFKRLLPLLLAVPDFDGVRIHGGNTSADTEGCILVGSVRNSVDRISNCAPALGRVMQIIQDAAARREAVFLIIEGAT